MRHMDRRSFLQLGAGVLGAASVLGVSGGELSAAESSASKRRVGGQLRIGLINEVNGLSPLASSLATSGTYYGRAIFDPIAIVASDGTVQPYLCQTIRPNASHTAWTFKLRPGITFHDGTPLDSAALANHFQHLLHSPFSATSAFSTVTNVVQADSLTVMLQLSAPWVALPSYLTGTVGPGQLGLMFQANGLSPARQRNSCYCHMIAGRAGASPPWWPLVCTLVCVGQCGIYGPSVMLL